MRVLPAVVLALIISGAAPGQNYTISTFAGGALPVFNIPGKAAVLGYGVPRGIAADRAGNVFLNDHNSILRLDAATGILTRLVGNGTPGFSGDNGPATSAQLYGPMGVAVDSTGNLYIADSGNDRIRKVSNGVITTVAGNGRRRGAAQDLEGNRRRRLLMAAPFSMYQVGAEAMLPPREIGACQ